MIGKYFSNLWEAAKTARKQRIVDMVDRKKGSILLDCGCDNGFFSLRIAHKLNAKQVYGIEVNPPMVREATKAGVKVKSSDLNFPFPFKDEAFDVITADQVIEHLWDLDNFMSEIWRTLKIDGYAIISTENLASWHNVFALVLGLQPFSGPTPSFKKVIGYHPIHPAIENKGKDYFMPPHTKVLTTKALVKLAQLHNFKFEVLEGYGYTPFPSFVAKVLSKIDTAHTLFMTVKLKKI